MSVEPRKRTSIAAALLLSASSALVQADADGTPSAVDDNLFAAAAAGSGAVEVAMSRLGLEKAVDPELKRFSQMMIDEQAKLDEEPSRAAATKGIALPVEVGVGPRFKLQSLADLSGEEFDKCYAEAQAVAHKDASRSSRPRRGWDADVKAFAAKALPKIQGHLDMIQPIAMRFEKSGAPPRVSEPDVLRAYPSRPGGAVGDEGAGEVQQRLVIRRLLLPADEQPSESIHPAMRPLHHPTPRPIAGFAAFSAASTPLALT